MPKVAQALKKLPEIYGTRRFITVFIRTLAGLYLERDESTSLSCFSKIRFNIILLS
jgi:hypothetical protein